jgi:integrase
MTVGEFVAARIAVWRNNDLISRTSAERYSGLLRCQIAPHIGGIEMQKLSGPRLEQWHGDLLTAGIAPRTIHAVHHLLRKVIKQAKQAGIVSRDPTTDISPPRLREHDVTILELEQVPVVLDALRGKALLPMAAVAIHCGLRRGEVLALRWKAVNLETKHLEVVANLVEYDDGSLSFEQPKTKAGRRKIKMPDDVVDILRQHRREQLELRMKLGLGKMSDETLLFSTPNGEPLSPRAMSRRWERFAKKLGIGKVVFHSLRHTQASLLHAAGVALATISKRLGHAKVSTTLDIYTHVFRDADDEAAAALNKTLAGGKAKG